MLFSLGIPDENPNQEIPDTKWNYALDSSAKEIMVEHFKMPEKWEWTITNAPLHLLVKAREFDWHPTENEPPPDNLVDNGKPVTITLVPYGCAKFRVTMFPLTKTCWDSSEN